MYGASYLAIAFCFGLSAGTIAKIKGSSFVIWFFIGAVLPVLGTLAALAWRWETHELRRECEECGKVVMLHDQVCTRCGADLEWPEQAIAPKAFASGH
ncbi:MAG: hypothetical protein QOJ07_3749 [Thermoleophilaceae bacterium]|jgi:hypothetical protein|nr:hypothetical protein [Thermoleophilaceae bacterium]